MSFSLYEYVPVLCCTLLVFCCTGLAQTSQLPGGDAIGLCQRRVPTNFFSGLLCDQKTFFLRPFQLQGSDETWLVPFAATTSLLIGSDTSIRKDLPQDTSVVTDSRRLSNYAVGSLLASAGALYLSGSVVRDEHGQETGLLSAEALADTMLVSAAMKLTCGRERPQQGSGDGRFGRGGTSFPSQHAAAAWSIASVLTHEYPGPLTQLFAYGAATAVSVSRVTAQEHFASDVFVGSALGWYMGRQVYRSRHNLESQGASWDDRHGASEAGSRNPKNMGSPYVALDNWIYPAFERLAALGYVPAAFLGNRPWTRLECARMLAQTKELIVAKVADDEARKIHAALTREFANEDQLLEGNSNRGAAVDSVYLRAGWIEGLPLRDGYHFGQTWINDYGRPYAEGFNTLAGASAHAEAGPLSAQIQGEYQHAPDVASDPASVLQATASVDSTHPLSNGTAQIDRFQMLSGTVAVTMRNVQISIGKQSVWLGPTQAGAFLVSNNAAPMPMLRIDQTSPLELPGISRLLGPMRSEFFLGRLSGQKWEYSPTLFGPNLHSQPFIHGTKISFHPTSNLEFGMGFTAQFGGDGNPFTWPNFLRTFYSHRFGTDRNPGKRLSEFDFSYRVPRVRDWVQLYLDSMVIDEYSPLGSSRPAINPGVYLPRLPKLHRMDLRFEGITTDLNVPAHFGLGAFYWDNRYRSGYTNDGNLIGSWIGRRGRGEQTWIGYHFWPRSDLQFGYRHNNIDPAFLNGGHLQDLTARANFLVDSQLSVSGLVQRETWSFPVLSPTPQSNLSAWVELTFWPKSIQK